LRETTKANGEDDTEVIAAAKPSGEGDKKKKPAPLGSHKNAGEEKKS